METKIVVLVKDERRYLEEWIKYHLDLGFSAIDVYEDYGSCSHLDITSRFSGVNLIRLDDNPKFVCDDYGTAYRYGRLVENEIREGAGRFDWLTCIDVDEFIKFEDGYTLETFLDGFGAYPGVYLYWKYMSASGHVGRCPNVLGSYTEESPFVNEGKYEFKCFFNVGKSLMLYGHSHHCARYGVNTERVPFLTHRIDEFSRKKSYSKAWIGHYFTKSWEDWCERIYEKGNLTYNTRHLLDFFDYNPDMLGMKDELVGELVGRRPKSTIWLDSDESILYTGEKVGSEESIALNKTI